MVDHSVFITSTLNLLNPEIKTQIAVEELSKKIESIENSHPLSPEIKQKELSAFAELSDPSKLSISPIEIKKIFFNKSYALIKDVLKFSENFSKNDKKMFSLENIPLQSNVHFEENVNLICFLRVFFLNLIRNIDCRQKWYGKLSDRNPYQEEILKVNLQIIKKIVPELLDYLKNYGLHPYHRDALEILWNDCQFFPIFGCVYIISETYQVAIKQFDDENFEIEPSLYKISDPEQWQLGAYGQYPAALEKVKELKIVKDLTEEIVLRWGNEKKPALSSNSALFWRKEKNTEEKIKLVKISQEVKECKIIIPYCIVGLHYTEKLIPSYSFPWMGFEQFCRDIPRANHRESRLILIEGSPILFKSLRALSEKFMNHKRILNKEEKDLRAEKMQYFFDQKILPGLKKLNPKFTDASLKQLLLNFTQNLFSTPVMWLFQCLQDKFMREYKQPILGIPRAEQNLINISFDDGVLSIFTLVKGISVNLPGKVLGEIDNKTAFPLGPPAKMIMNFYLSEQRGLEPAAATNSAQLARELLIGFCHRRLNAYQMMEGKAHELSKRNVFIRLFKHLIKNPPEEIRLAELFEELSHSNTLEAADNLLLAKYDVLVLAPEVDIILAVFAYCVPENDFQKKIIDLSSFPMDVQLKIQKALQNVLAIEDHYAAVIVHLNEEGELTTSITIEEIRSLSVLQKKLASLPHCSIAPTSGAPSPRLRC